MGEERNIRQEETGAHCSLNSLQSEDAEDHHFGLRIQ